MRLSWGNVEAKKEEIAELEQKAENATASQMNTPVEANKAVEEAAVAERNDNKTSDAKEEKTAENTTEKAEESSTNGEKEQGSVSDIELQTENVENVQPVETAVSEVTTAQAATHTHVDVRL